MDKNILGLIKSDETSRKRMHQYLVPCYEKIVLPMALLLKKMMMQF